MSVWELPTSIEISGVGYSIRSDFRAVIDILLAFADPEYEEDEKALICLEILYEDFDRIPRECYQEAVDKAVEFIDAGAERDGRKKPSVMDWAQDAPIIIPAINRIAGTEIRAMKYLHWWTFMGYYMEIGEGLFMSVLNIRQKKAKGKKLESYEKEFYRENKSLIDIKIKYTDEEKEEQERLKKLLGG